LHKRGYTELLIQRGKKKKKKEGERLLTPYVSSRKKPKKQERRTTPVGVFPKKKENRLVRQKTVRGKVAHRRLLVLEERHFRRWCAMQQGKKGEPG